jgi:small-conductance mechanosensitive channel
MVESLFEVHTWMIRIVLGLLIFIVGLIIGKILGKIVEKLILNLGITEVIQKITTLSIKTEKIVAEIVSYVIYFLGFVMALNQIGITTTVLNILSGAVLVLVLIVIFLSVKDIIPNIVAGFLIHGKSLINEGDTIKIHDIEGKVIQTNLVETRIETQSKDIIFVPNARLVKYEVIKRNVANKKIKTKKKSEKVTSNISENIVEEKKETN